MTSLFEQRLTALKTGNGIDGLKTLYRGIEKESLRVQTNGNIAQTPHPAAFGSALTNPHITTDFSEALLEFITPVSKSVDEVLTWLTEVHQCCYSSLKDEYLWTSSMPCVLPIDDGIPVAQYGSSNVAKMKTVYRLGLGHRYGRAMQTIAGIHYNFSFSDEFWTDYQQVLASDLSLQDFKTEQYFNLIRNFRRYSWLLVYLFGASPALCQTFLGHESHSLQNLGLGTLHAPKGTSLRMGDLGYQSNAQENLYVCYNSLAQYTKTLGHALTDSIAEYEAIGTHDADGNRIQLSTALLQIENEFYSSIRPKRVALSGESPLNALNDRGVEYIEVRCLDVSPYAPMGIDAEQIRFIDAFLLYCLLDESPGIEKDEYHQLIADNKTVVNDGRSEDATVHIKGQTIPIPAAVAQLMAAIRPCAELLDSAHQDDQYMAGWTAQEAKAKDPQQLPSAQILRDIADHGNSYFKFAMAQAEKHQQWFKERPLSAQRAEYYAEVAAHSNNTREAIEAADTTDFESFLKHYYDSQNQ